jgi:hypothetical protein
LAGIASPGQIIISLVTLTSPDGNLYVNVEPDITPDLLVPPLFPFYASASQPGTSYGNISVTSSSGVANGLIPLIPQPVQPVAVLIDSQPASVAFCGEAPGLVSGVLQVNVQIPANARSGNLPVQVLIGQSNGPLSRSGVTVSVQ